MHPQRYLVALGAAGILHGLGVAYGALLTPGVPAAAPHVFFSPALLAAFAVPSAWIVGWLLRRRIAAAHGAALLVQTLLATLLGIFVGGTLLVASSGALWLVEGDAWRATLALLFCWALGGLITLLWGWTLLPWALPLTWLAVLGLRAAAGGTTEALPPRRPRPGRGLGPGPAA